MAAERKHQNEDASADFNPWRDISLVVTFLTRLPLPFAGGSPRPLAKAAWAFPVAGLLTGGVGGGVYYGATLMGASPLICLVLGLVASVLISGGLHEDGLADVADGFGGGSTREKKLAIMRDSRIGAFGVLALIFSVSLRLAALSAIAEQTGAAAVFAVFLGSAMFTRGVLPALMAVLPPARDDGLSRTAGRPGAVGALAALGLGVMGAVISLHYSFPPIAYAMFGAVVAVFLLGLIARRQIGGQTGDVIGAAQQVSETAFLIGLSLAMEG